MKIRRRDPLLPELEFARGSVRLEGAGPPTLDAHTKAAALEIGARGRITA